MARAGWEVTVLEKNATPGGRARQLRADGFLFDMGPSWYWMPDVFEKFFAAFGRKPGDYYDLIRLNPSYRVVWPDGDSDIPADAACLGRLLESWETGASLRLEQFLQEAAQKYRIGMERLVYKPGLSLTEFADRDTLLGVLRLDVFTSMKKHVRRYFRHPRIRQLMEFPVLFLGALPGRTPALYSLMNHADISGGTWYPYGGMYSVVQGIHKLALELGVQFRFSEPVTGFETGPSSVREVITQQGRYEADAVIAGADYHHVESLLPLRLRNYSTSYWDRRRMAPSCLIYYVGVDKKLPGLRHHTLFFDASLDAHGREIYDTPLWPSDPLFYVCAASVTDASVAPEGHENLFFLVPVATGLEDTLEITERYFQIILDRFERRTGHSIRNNIVFRRAFAGSEFISDYNSFRGNAYGLANTLMQTAVMKPKCRNRRLRNLYYTGQLTVPGPGVPPSLISGEVVAGVALSTQKQRL